MIQPEFPRAPRRWPRRLGALLLLAAVAWAWTGASDTIRHGHPAYLVLAGLATVGALVVAMRRPVHTRRWVARAVGLFLVWALALGVLVAARPSPAEEPALSAMRGTAAVEVREESTTITLAPTGATAPVGLVFYAGGFVDPRAYAALLTPIAAAGHPVVIVKPPLGVGVLAWGAADTAEGRLPATHRWVVGGHSLGGVAAAADVGRDPTAYAGLLLWGSYPSSSIASASLPVLSVYGTHDGASTPRRVLASAGDLPADARFVAVEGSIHAYFGDYGPQRGADGEPTVSRADAQHAIVADTLDWLSGLR